ncbi:hypothetical protein [Streptomyces silaceus]|uniref:hypothetical protein n=1 Tax=Streptomyces silaceus TaxID=545123 RepID=UPI0006EB9272|nr:hypothetical protein [Streptomyces silaceus]
MRTKPLAPAHPSNGQLTNPRARYCSHTAELDGKPEAAFGARNETQRTVVICSDAKCTGTQTMMQTGDELGDDVMSGPVGIVGSD